MPNVNLALNMENRKESEYDDEQNEESKEFAEVSGVSSEFGACLDDSETLEFVREYTVHERIEGFGELGDP